MSESVKKMRPMLDWGSILSRPKSQNEQPGPSVPESVTKEEFATRYQRLLLIQWILVGMMLMDLVVFATSSGLIANLTCLIVMGIYLIVYLRYSYTAWASNKVWNNWKDRNLPFIYTMKDYLDALAQDPGLLVPKKLQRNTYK